MSVEIWTMTDEFEGICFKKGIDSSIYTFITDYLYGLYLPKTKERIGINSFNLAVSLNEGVWNKLNHKMNESDNIFHRILWELICGQIFFKKDISLIINSLYKLKSETNINESYTNDSLNVLIETFKQSQINDNFEFIMFKRNTINSHVWNYFLNSEGDKEIPLYLNDEYLTEFVIIDGDVIVEFIPNTSFDYGKYNIYNKRYYIVMWNSTFTGFGVYDSIKYHTMKENIELLLPLWNKEKDDLSINIFDNVAVEIMDFDDSFDVSEISLSEYEAFMKINNGRVNDVFHKLHKTLTDWIQRIN